MGVVHVFHAIDRENRRNDRFRVRPLRHAEHQDADRGTDLGESMPEDVGRDHERQDRVDQRPVVEQDDDAAEDDSDRCQRVGDVVKQLQDAGIEISLFIDPEADQIEASRELGVSAIELHTGCYADATSDMAQLNELRKLDAAGKAARAVLTTAS